jgi:hypothetical protein
MRSKLRSSTSVALRYGGATVASALTGLCSDLFFRLTGISRLSSIFLAGVLLSAFLFGSGPGYLASGLCFILYLWLVDPRYKFEFGSTEDFDTLMVFLAVSVLIGLLIGRKRRRGLGARTGRGHRRPARRHPRLRRRHGRGADPRRAGPKAGGDVARRGLRPAGARGPNLAAGPHGPGPRHRIARH